MLDGLTVKGPITGKFPKALDCMISRAKLLNEVSDSFRKKPAEYVSIFGPVQCGKSTILEQIRTSLEANANPIIVVVMDMLHFRKDDSFEHISSRIVRTMKLAVSRFLGDGEFGDFGVGDNSADDPIFSNRQFAVSLDTEIESIVATLPGNCRITLALENVDMIEESATWDVLSELRSIYERRAKTPLERFSVITTSTSSLTVQHGEISSPFNCAKEFYIEDTTEEEVRQFIDRISSLNTISFDDRAISLAVTYLRGTISLMQEVFSMLPTCPSITIDHMADAIASVLESSSRFSRYALNEDGLSLDGRAIILDLLQRVPVLGFEGNRGFRELRKRGLVGLSARHWAEFRSRLVELLAAVQFLDYRTYKLTREQSLIGNLPQIRLLLANGVYGGEILARSASRLARENPKAQARGKWDCILQEIEVSEIPIDWEFTYILLSRYWDIQELGRLPTMEQFQLDVKAIVATILLKSF